jgi:nucleoside-diphosphate-sugar epimerase
MKIFLTGATGYVGSAVAAALRRAGHQVHGLARDDRAEEKLVARGITPVRGDLSDPASRARAAETAAGVVHAGMRNDRQGPETDRAAVEAMLDALAGSGKPFVYTSGIWVVGATGDRVADEDTELDPIPLVRWRPPIERLVLDAAERGVRSVVIRPGVVYGKGGGIPAMLVASARERGAARYVGDGENRWPLVHADDLGELYARAVASAPAGTGLHGVDDSELRVAEIAAAAAHGAGAEGRTEAWPVEEAQAELGAGFAQALALDQRLSAGRARDLLGWRPAGPSILEELREGSYATS